MCLGWMDTTHPTPITLAISVQLFFFFLESMFQYLTLLAVNSIVFIWRGWLLCSLSVFKMCHMLLFTSSKVFLHCFSRQQHLRHSTELLELLSVVPGRAATTNPMQFLSTSMGSLGDPRGGTDNSKPRHDIFYA